MDKDFKLNNNQYKKTDDEIDFKKILNVIIRNKSIVLFFTLFLFALSGIYSYSKKKIWEGGFQIVVKESQNNSSQLSPFIGGSSLLQSITGQSSNLNTEVGILQSSSVLMPVFEFYKVERLKLNPNSEEISFLEWKNNLQVSLKPKTSILYITYKGKNKTLINKVLDETIKNYQEYSGKGKKRNLQLANNYLSEQIKFYKNKSSQSIKLVQQYALDQDLTILDYGYFNNNTNNGIGNFVPNNLIQSQSFPTLRNRNSNILGENVNIEIARVKAANQIRNIDIKLKKIESLENNDDIDQLSYLNLIIPNFEDSEDINDLTDLDLKILDLKSKYTDKYPGLERLYKKRNLLLGLLKEKSIDILKAQRVSAESVLEAATRPKGVLLKYKELVREANRDDDTLVQLEDKLREIQLQQARLEDPWELITSPTINNKPVAPNVSLIMFVWTLVGFILGFIISILKEKKTGFIFEEDILESLFNIKIIDNIELNKLDSELSVNQLFIKDIFRQNKDKSFKFYYSNYLDKLDPKSLRLIFQNNKNNYSIINDFADIQDNEIMILVTRIPGITFEEVKKIKTKLEILGKEFFGIVIVND